MAKKRKAKVKKSKAVAAKKIPEARMTLIKAAYILGVASGLVILIAGILALLGIRMWGREAIAATTINMAIGIVCGIAILIATATARKKPRASGIVMLVFSLLALATPPTYGFIFGPVLGLIGSVLLLLRR